MSSPRIIECAGSPFEIGLVHGKSARARIHKGIAVYKTLFKEDVNLSWHAANQCAEKFLPAITQHVPHLLEEMRGIAEGAGTSFLDIVTLNARSEIALTKPNLSDPPDGCTAFSKSIDGIQWLSQNWDWRASQQDQIIILRIKVAEDLHITTISEAGMVAKVGMNNHGVAVTLNALKTVQLDASKLPIHLGLRLVLESTSTAEALHKLEQVGIASAAHFLIADPTSSIGIEVNPIQPFGILLPDAQNNIFHTNHCISEDLPGSLTEIPWLVDSPIRLARIAQLVNATQNFDYDSIFEMYKDETNGPNSINRDRDEKAGSEICTVFNIVMNTTHKRFIVKFGRPTEATETLTFNY